MSAHVAQLLAPFSTHEVQGIGGKALAMRGRSIPARSAMRMKMKMHIGASESGVQSAGFGQVVRRGHEHSGDLVCRAGVEKITQDVDLGGGDEGGDGKDPPVLKSTDEEDKDGEGRAILMDALIKVGDEGEDTEEESE